MPTATLRHRRTWNGSAPRLVAGLISGTSADGIDTVLVEVRFRRQRFSVKQRAFATIPYPRGMREHLLGHSLSGAGSVDSITRLNAVVARCFAAAVITLARRARIPLTSIHLIGTHGQTMHHLPSARPLFGFDSRSTLQVGDPSLIAQLTGIPTVGDFRPADMAAGGQGAPLVPFLDYHVFRSSTRSRLLLNLGGIANFTVLPRGCSSTDVTAFDTGPANMVIDALTERFYRQSFDRRGRRAAAGSIDLRLLKWMMSHPYIDRHPPKSTGREVFGNDFINELLRRGKGLSASDILATATEFTAVSIVRNYERFVCRTTPVDEVIVSGGGAHNDHLMNRLRVHFDPIPVAPSTDVGFSVDAKEAILFAVLGVATVLGIPSNMPRATGAHRSVILGKICLP